MRRLLHVAIWFLLVGFPSSGPSPSLAAPPGSGLPDIDAFMQIGYAGSPQISPDGRTLYFTSNSSGVDQIYRRDIQDGWPYQLTVFTEGVDFYAMSVDGTRLVCGVGAGGNENSQLWLIDPRTGAAAALTGAPEVRHGSPVFSPDSRTLYFISNAANGKDFHVYARDLETGRTRTLLEMEGSNSAGDLSDDGKWLLVTHYGSNVDSDIYLVDTARGRTTHLTPHEGEVFHQAAQFDASGKRLYLISNGNPDGVARRATLDLESKQVSFLDTEGPWEVELLGISPDRNIMGWTVNEDGYVRLRLVDLTTGFDLPVPPVDGLVSSFGFTRGGSRVAFSFSSAVSTSDVWEWDWKAPSLEKRTFSTYAGVDPASFSAPKLIRYASFDGLEIPAFLYLPPGARPGTPVPFIIHLHGGPESQFQPAFIRHFQYLLLRGYGILAPNVRGSSGYGREYLGLDNYTRRLDSVKDLKAAAEFLVREGYSAPGMLAVKGGSYGGYMTLAAVTEYPDLFSAAVDEVGIANFVSFLENTAEYRRYLREAEYGPLSDRKFLESISPLHKAASIKTPLLVIHGENDPRVPVGEARQIVEAIRAKGGEVDTLYFADEGHGVSKRANVLVQYRKIAEFLGRYLPHDPPAQEN